MCGHLIRKDNMKKEILSPGGILIVSEKKESTKKQAKVKDVRATGVMVIVEILTNDEASGSEILTTGDSHQALVYSTGPQLDVEKWGFKKDDRVLLQGKFVPLDVVEGRKFASIDPNSIKAVLLN